ncbi:MAG: prepilin-type N-terminal cleavage/methylation domain-containing protein [Bacteroidota bacterium]
MNKVKAFTIMEVTITMLISAVLIGIAYTSYSIIIKSYNSFNDKNNKLAVLYNLDHLLKRDFDQAAIISKDQSDIAIKKDNVLITYKFYADFVTRKGASIDTFKVQTDGLITNFENAPVIGLAGSGNLKRVDELLFNVQFDKEKIPYHYTKVYSSENLVENTPDAIN